MIAMAYRRTLCAGLVVARVVSRHNTARLKKNERKSIRGGNEENGTNPMGITKSDFGKTKRGAIDLYTLSNGSGHCRQVIPMEDHTDCASRTKRARARLVLGFPTSMRTFRSPFFGAIAGRYANRIAKGKFTLMTRTTSWRSITGPTACTAASRFRQGGMKAQPTNSPMARHQAQITPAPMREGFIPARCIPHARIRSPRTRAEDRI